MPTQRLSGAVALVTGANHGIGAATAIALAQRGADIAVSYLRTGDPGRSDGYNRARDRRGAATVARSSRSDGGRSL